MSSLITLEIDGLWQETHLAWQVEYEEKIYWVPKSECKLDGNHLEIPFWLAEEKGII